MAQPFDAGTRTLTGDPFPIAEQVAAESNRSAAFTASPGGVLVHARGTVGKSHLRWMDRSGTSLGEVGAPGDYVSVALAPDEGRVAVSLVTENPPNRDIWTLDAVKSGSSRLTFDTQAEVSPVWSPDGNWLAFGSAGRPPSGVYQKPSRGAAQEQLLLKSDRVGTFPTDWSRDGRFIAYTLDTGAWATSLDIWTLPMTGDRTPRPFLQTAAIEDNAVFAPDGRSLAYESNESGQYQVYVQTLFPSGASATRRPYAVRRDGKAFLVNTPERTIQSAVTVVVNWLGAVQR